MIAELDPRWEWVEMRRMCEPPGTHYVKSRCNHLEVVPVESAVDGEVVAHLCRTCDTQLPREWRP